MSQNQGSFGRNFKRNQERNHDYNNKNSKYRKGDMESESYGIFDETTFAKQKITIEGFEREEKPRANLKPEVRKERHVSTSSRPASSNYVRSNAQNVPQVSTTNFFVFDIETIPCVETARAFLNLSSEVSDEEVVAKLTTYHSEITNGQNEFFRQLFHKVVCVSFIVGSIHALKGGREKYVIRSIRTGGKNGETEEEILRNLFSYLNKHPSRLISFNGRGFDLPVLQYRAMKYGIDARWIYNDGYYNYNHRYSIEKHCDLLDMFSNFGASARVKMAEIASLFKVPCKANGVTGSSVYDMYKAGKIEEICNYCEEDVIATYVLYLRFMQHSGRLSAEGYNIVIDNLIAKLQDAEAPAHQTLFAENFIKMNGGNVHIVTKSLKDANVESSSEDQSLTEGKPETSSEMTDEDFADAAGVNVEDELENSQMHHSDLQNDLINNEESPQEDVQFASSEDEIVPLEQDKN